MIEFFKKQWEKILMGLAFIFLTLQALRKQNKGIKEERRAKEDEVKQVEDKIEVKKQELAKKDMDVEQAEKDLYATNEAFDEAVEEYLRDKLLDELEGLDTTVSEEIE